MGSERLFRCLVGRDRPLLQAVFSGWRIETKNLQLEACEAELASKDRQFGFVSEELLRIRAGSVDAPETPQPRRANPLGADPERYLEDRDDVRGLGSPRD